MIPINHGCLVYLNHKSNVCWTFVSGQSFRISNVQYNFRHVHKLVVAFPFYAGKFYARTHGKITRSLWVEIHPYSVNVTTSSKHDINYANDPFLVCGKFKNRRRGESLGAFRVVKISGISGSAVNGTRFIGSSHWKIPRKKWKIWKGGLLFPVGISERNFVFHSHVSRSLYQFQVHGKKICHGQLANQNGFPRAHVSMRFVFLLAPQWKHFCTTSALTLD